MIHSRWRRFLPSRRIGLLRNDSDDNFSRAQSILNSTKVNNFEQLDREIERRKHDQDEQDVIGWLVLLILQGPRAAHAQAMMDENPRGYHDRSKRLYELIDFNDTLVSTVLLLPERELASFTDKLRAALDAFNKKMYSRKFSDDQFEAIVHGLSREIAVFKAVKNAGLQVLMASRTADAFGIDMQIQEPTGGNYINVDCKTSSSFHFRLKDLMHDRRITEHDMTEAETKGWWEITNKKEGRSIKIILLRVSQDELGKVQAFRFLNEQRLVELIKLILTQRGLADNQFGRLWQ